MKAVRDTQVSTEKLLNRILITEQDSLNHRALGRTNVLRINDQMR